MKKYAGSVKQSQVASKLRQRFLVRFPDLGTELDFIVEGFKWLEDRGAAIPYAYTHPTDDEYILRCFKFWHGMLTRQSRTWTDEMQATTRDMHRAMAVVEERIRLEMTK